MFLHHSQMLVYHTLGNLLVQGFWYAAHQYKHTTTESVEVYSTINQLLPYIVYTCALVLIFWCRMFQLILSLQSIDSK